MGLSLSAVLLRQDALETQARAQPMDALCGRAARNARPALALALAQMRAPRARCG
jgi:hypothetical protein